jgi:hypothetical protein
MHPLQFYSIPASVTGRVFPWKGWTLTTFLESQSWGVPLTLDACASQVLPSCPRPMQIVHTAWFLLLLSSSVFSTEVLDRLDLPERGEGRICEHLFWAANIKGTISFHPQGHPTGKRGLLYWGGRPKLRRHSQLMAEMRVRPTLLDSREHPALPCCVLRCQESGLISVPQGRKAGPSSDTWSLF